MNEIKKKVIRHDYDYLQSFCKENNIELIKDLSECN